MDNAIFKKLQDAVLHPTRSKEWFGMAEQAINTIYALGEHPDVLCNELIKVLTRRVFAADKKAHSKTPTPDAMDEDETPDADGTPSSATPQPHSSGPQDVGDAFELSQLLFIVGHVAIKQIVYLELVEREWKRQKDEKEKGTSYVILQRIKNLCLDSGKERRR